MQSSWRARGFSLIEAMTVVTLIGVLALLATAGYRRWVRTAYLTEAQDMVANIRSAEESFRAENGGYMNVSLDLGPGNDYPLEIPGRAKTFWGGPCSKCVDPKAWASLNVQPSGPVAFGYSLRAANKTLPDIPTRTVNGKTLDTSAMNLADTPWYFIEADGDIDGNSIFTKVYSMSASNQLFVDNEGE